MEGIKKISRSITIKNNEIIRLIDLKWYQGYSLDKYINFSIVLELTHFGSEISSSFNIKIEKSDLH